MQNIELLLNPSVAPVYITATNMLYPITVLTLSSIQTMAATLLENILYTLMIIAHTLYFVAKNIVSEFDKMDGTQKFLSLFCFYNLLLTIIATHKVEETQEYKKQIRTLKKQVEMQELLRNDNMNLMMDELNVFRNETNIKISTLDKKIKKIEPKVYYLEREMKKFN